MNDDYVDNDYDVDGAENITMIMIMIMINRLMMVLYVWIVFM